MSNTARDFLLGPLLKGVSRSFYLTLRVLPAGMRDPVALAYLLARAADTIADTSLIAPAQRLELLLALREQVNGASLDADTGAAASAFARRLSGEVAARQTQSDEKVLLESIGPALAMFAQSSDADRAAVRDIVTTLTTGMEFDLRTFPDERSGHIAALSDLETLDRYTYLVAGCVGEFWTKMTDAHVPGVLEADVETMIERGVRFGKALQMTNVLRDCAKDLRIGRCYLPASLLVRYGLTPEDLLSADASARAKPVMHVLVGTTLERYRDALAYTLAIPRRALRLRLACIWPILIGLETLALLVDNDRWLDPGCVSKVKRGDIYRIVAGSSLIAASDTLLRHRVQSWIAKVEARLSGAASADRARTASSKRSSIVE